MTTTIPTYAAAKAWRLIREKKAQGEYHVTGSLYLSGCDLSGVTLPASVGGSIYLSGCRNPDPSQWWTERGEATRRRCIAVCPDYDYALVQTDTDHFSAGCRNNLTRAQALKHWNRTDERAKLFTAAIEEAVL